MKLQRDENRRPTFITYADRLGQVEAAVVDRVQQACDRAEEVKGEAVTLTILTSDELRDLTSKDADRIDTEVIERLISWGYKLQVTAVRGPGRHCTVVHPSHPVVRQVAAPPVCR